jgi:hypothetical protein
MVTERLPEAAFYYPGVIWRSANWVKSLALFFDQVALLVPDYMRDRPMALDPAIAAGLQDAGLLTILSPEALIDQAATERLAGSLVDIITSGALDDLPPSSDFAELSWSRLGGVGDLGLAQMIFEDLRKRGLARDTEDGFSIPMHPMVRSLVLVLLAQILKESGPQVGLDLCPATDRPRIQAALGDVIGAVSTAGPADVVEVDLEFVAPDLSAVPMDELLDFRERHASEYRAYARGLREVVRDLRAADPGERESILTDRREALKDAAQDLKRGPLKDVAVKGALALGVLAGIAGIVEGSEVSGAISIAATAGGGIAGRRRPPATYSYLFAARNQLA